MDELEVCFKAATNGEDLLATGVAARLLYSLNGYPNGSPNGFLNGSPNGSPNGSSFQTPDRDSPHGAMSRQQQSQRSVEGAPQKSDAPLILRLSLEQAIAAADRESHG